MYACVYTALWQYECDNLRENATGKRTGKEISVFCAESAKVVSSSDLCLADIEKVGFTKKLTGILLKNVSS